ncbi:MAG: DUF115 domain-containing protein [Treponema sp.]|nr:DUF115 domain-containing protein [Treponema sp.]
MCKNLQLHSRYNPQAEADRYIDSFDLNNNTLYFILIEPGFCYLTAPIKKKVPGAKIIALHAEELPQNTPQGIINPDSRWAPGTGVPLKDFLEKEIPDCEASRIQIIEWRPALNIYGRKYLSLMEESVDFIKRADANTRTIKTFGLRWVRNFFRNLNLIRTVLMPKSLSIPIYIAGAGPSLEDQNIIMKAAPREEYYILSASSAVMALREAGLTPDMIIATDGTPWALLHLYEAFRPELNMPLAISMTASLPSECITLPLLPISDGSLWQSIILKELKIPFITLPQRGTVTATALDLAFTLTEGEVYICGMDLVNRDLLSHSRPYSFDLLLEKEERRLNPFYSQKYKRSTLLHSGGSYGIYTAWFKKQVENYPKRLYSLGDNNPIFDSYRAGNKKPGKNLSMEKTVRFNTIKIKHDSKPSYIAIAILEKALSNPKTGEILSNELFPLVLPDNNNRSVDDLLGALKRI